MTGLFDRIFCIHLESRADRMAHMLAHLPSLGIGPGDVEWWPARRTIPGRHGAAMAHRGIAERQLREGWGRVLVLEDDVRLIRRRALHYVGAAMADAPWDVFYLGAQANPRHARIVGEAEHSFRVVGLTGCFAVAYSPRICRALVPNVSPVGTIAGGLHVDRLVEQLVQEGMVARCPRNLPVGHALVGRSDTDVSPRPQGVSEEYHKAWFAHMKRGWATRYPRRWVPGRAPATPAS